MKKKWFIDLFLAFARITGGLPAWLFFKPRVFRAKRRLPKSCIIVSNHKSLLDFVLYLLVFPFRTVRFLMAEVLYNKGKFFSFLLNSLGGVRVNRDDRDFSFVSEALEILDAGGTVGVFPEARLPVGGKPFPFTTSTAFIAMNCDAPIVPVYTDGRYGIFKRTGVCVGEPFHLTDYMKDGISTEEQLKYLTDILHDKVYSLEKELICRKQQHRLFDIRRLPMDMSRFVMSALMPVLRIKRLTPEGERYKVKIKGGAIIAANHTSFLDPFIAGLTFWYRRMHYLVAEIVMGGRVRSFFLKGVGAIRIDRNAADVEGIDRAITKLREGYLLTVFPQGGIQKDNDVNDIKSGAVLMAIRAGVPIVPMHIVGRKRWYERQTVIIGNPVNPADYSTRKVPSFADIKNITDALVSELKRCKAAGNDENALEK